MVFDFKKYAEALLGNAVGASKVTLRFGVPPIEIEFNREDFIATLRNSGLASRVVSRCFCRRKVFRADLSLEEYEEVINVLEYLETSLDEFEDEMLSNQDSGSIGMAKIIRTWGSIVVNIRKGLYDEIKEIKKEKAKDPFYEDSREDIHRVTKKAVIDLRILVYPLILTLCSLIDSEDQTRYEAIEIIDSGLKYLSSKQAIELYPDLEVK